MLVPYLKITLLTEDLMRDGAVFTSAEWIIKYIINMQSYILAEMLREVAMIPPPPAK